MSLVLASETILNKYCLSALLNDFEKALDNPESPSTVFHGGKIEYKIWREWKNIIQDNQLTMIEFYEVPAHIYCNIKLPAPRQHINNMVLGHIYDKYATSNNECWFIITTKHGAFFDYLLNRNNFHHFPLLVTMAEINAIDYLINTCNLNKWNSAEWKRALNKKDAPKENMTFVNNEPKVVKQGEPIPLINNNNSNYSNNITVKSNDAINYATLTLDETVINTSTTLKSAVDNIEERVTKLEKENENTMDTNKVLNFDFGPVSTSVFRLSPYGIAANMGDRWVAYDKNKGDIMDVEVFNFKMDRVIYKVPAPITALKPGDMIIHQKIPMFVKSIDNVANTVEAINFRDCTVNNILPVKSPFGFNFVTKIISFIDMGNMSPDADNPFGNMLPLMLLSNQENSKMDPLLLCMMIQGGQMDFSNPMMMYLMLRGDDTNNDNLLPLMFMMQNK